MMFDLTPRVGCMHAQDGYTALIYALSENNDKALGMVKSLMRSRKTLNLSQYTKKDGTSANALFIAIARSSGFPPIQKAIEEMIDFASTSGQTDIFLAQTVRHHSYGLSIV
jgi:hypothetical protein